MMQKRPADRVARASEVVELLRPWVDAAPENSWQAIGVMAKSSGERALHESTLADTVSATIEPAEMVTPESSHPNRAPFITRAALPQQQESLPDPVMVKEEQPTPSMSRGTVALLVLAAGIALAVIGLLLMNL